MKSDRLYGGSSLRAIAMGAGFVATVLEVGLLPISEITEFRNAAEPCSADLSGPMVSQGCSFIPVPRMPGRPADKTPSPTYPTLSGTVSSSINTVTPSWIPGTPIR